MSRRLCEVIGCDRGHAAHGLCRRHYEAAQRRAGRLSCPADGCEGFVKRDGDAGCHRHRWSLDGLCVVDGCDRQAEARGCCRTHHARLVRHGSTDLPPRERKVCTLDGCNRTSTARGMCPTHYQAWRTDGGATTPRRAPDGAGHLNAQGYRVLSRPGHPAATKQGVVLEHRMVMSDLLGRALLPGENVHHRNGDRADNRPANLELWVQAQPAGQHVDDVVEHAVAMLRRYAPRHLATG